MPGIGLLIGLPITVLVAFLARSILLGVAPLDPFALGGGTGVLLLAALLAGIFPAMRLKAAEPMEVLREE